MNTAEFINKANTIHNNQYDYSRVQYINTHTKVEIICPTHGPFLKAPVKHIGKEKAGCPTCIKLTTRYKQAKFKTKEELFSFCSDIHQNQYVYHDVLTKVDGLITTNDEIIYECKEHGIFYKTITDHIHMKTGCPTCGKNTAAVSLRKSSEEFVQQANITHQNKFDYSKMVYINSDTPIIIICPIHGEFKQRPGSHLNSKFGCRQCDNDYKSKTHSMGTDEFIKRSEKLYGDRFDYKETEFISSHKHVTLICKQHGSFSIKPTDHLRNYCICRKCKASGPELIIMNYLDQNKIEYVFQHTFDDCRGIRKRLPFDFYLPSFNALIEYDGIHHTLAIPFYGQQNEANERLKAMIHNDEMKTKYAEDQNINLLRISHQQKHRIIETLDDFIRSLQPS